MQKKEALSLSSNPIVTWFKTCLENQGLRQKLEKINFVVADVDGTLTDASIYVTDQGEGGRNFNIQDGYIVKPALKAGLTIAFMSGKNNASTIERGTSLGIDKELCQVGIKDKRIAIKRLQEKYNFSVQQSALIGDDFLDAQVTQAKLVSIFACPTNTPFYLSPLANLTLPLPGGHGAFRLFIDLILYAQNKHFAQDLIELSLRNHE